MATITVDIPQRVLDAWEERASGKYELADCASDVLHTPCHLWTKGKDKDGYGLFSVYGAPHNPKSGKAFRAHRVAYTVEKGQIPLEHVVHHVCGVVNCVNPDHLEAVTTRENLWLSPLSSSSREACPHGHLYDEENTCWVNGTRSCRACARRHMSKLRAGRDPADAPVHGTHSTYSNWKCRCHECKAAMREFHREYKVRKKAEREAASA